MEEFDQWVGFLVRWGCTVAILLGVASLALWALVEFTVGKWWKDMSVLRRVAWVAAIRKWDVDRAEKDLRRRMKWRKETGEDV